MKKLFTILLTVTSLTINACQQEMKKYEWIPTECAPKNYPVQVFKGLFTYGGGKTVPVPNGRVVNYGWGENGSVNLVGDKLKEAPETLEISWISFVERKNYAGKFELDTKKIDSLFEAGYPDDTEESGKGNYNYIKVGMAPQGEVVIWLTGVRNKQVEVGHFTAKAVTAIDWKAAYPDMEGSFDVYINNVLKDLPEGGHDNSNTPGYWSDIRKRYEWKVLVEQPQTLTRIDVDYLNKERDFVFGADLKHIDYSLLAPVEELSVYWLDDKNRELRTEIRFDEKETAGLFSRITPGTKADLVVKIDPVKKNIDVSLKTDKGNLTFNTLKVQSFYK